MSGDPFIPTGASSPSSIEVDEFQASIHAKRVTTIPSDLQLRMDYDGSGNLIYVGTGTRSLAASDTGWAINKFTWTGGNLTLKQTAYDAWDNRASATYA